MESKSRSLGTANVIRYCGDDNYDSINRADCFVDVFPFVVFLRQ